MLTVPSAKDFEKSEFLDAPELKEIAHRLIAEDHALEWILSLRLAYLWKKSTPKSQGRPVPGQGQKTPKLLRHFVNTEWVIWLAAGEFADCGLADIAVERELYHQLLHFQENPKTGKATRRGHDTETFIQEEVKYGRVAA